MRSPSSTRRGRKAPPPRSSARSRPRAHPESMSRCNSAICRRFPAASPASTSTVATPRPTPISWPADTATSSFTDSKSDSQLGATLNGNSLSAGNYSYYVTYYNSSTGLESRPTALIGPQSLFARMAATLNCRTFHSRPAATSTPSASIATRRPIRPTSTSTPRSIPAPALTSTVSPTRPSRAIRRSI